VPILLAVLSLLGGCSGMLDLPEEPRVGVESRAPLEPQPEHGASRGSGTWHGQNGRPERAAAPDEPGWPRSADAGAAESPADGGVEVRISSG
jgi:hypothetical protein